MQHTRRQVNTSSFGGGRQYNRMWAIDFSRRPRTSKLAGKLYAAFVAMVYGSKIGMPCRLSHRGVVPSSNIDCKQQSLCCIPGYSDLNRSAFYGVTVRIYSNRYACETRHSDAVSCVGPLVASNILQPKTCCIKRPSVLHCHAEPCNEVFTLKIHFSVVKRCPLPV